MIYDLLAAGLFALFVGRGVVAGFWTTLLRRVGLGLGWFLAATLAPVYAPDLAARWQMPLPVAVAVLGSGLLVICVALAAVAGILVRRTERRGRAGEARPLGDQLGGALVGAVPGLVGVVLVGWLALVGQALRESAGAEWIPASEDAQVARLSRGLLGAGVERWFADASPPSRATARALADPATATRRLQRLMERDSLQRLTGDPVFWNDLGHGRLEAALDRTSFHQLVWDRETRAHLARLGVVDEALADAPVAFHAAASEAFAEVSDRLGEIRRDPAFEQLLDDPEVRTLAELGDYVGLLSNPRVRAFVLKVLATPPA